MKSGSDHCTRFSRTSSIAIRSGLITRSVAASSGTLSSRTRAPRRSCLARRAATSTNRKRLSIAGALGCTDRGLVDRTFHLRDFHFRHSRLVYPGNRDPATGNRQPGSGIGIRDPGIRQPESGNRSRVSDPSELSGRQTTRYARPGAARIRLPDPGSRIPAYAATSTVMVRGRDSALTGSVTVSTPFLYSAAILVASTVCGSLNERLNEP